MKCAKCKLERCINPLECCEKNKVCVSCGEEEYMHLDGFCQWREEDTE